MFNFFCAVVLNVLQISCEEDGPYIVVSLTVKDLRYTRSYTV